MKYHIGVFSGRFHATRIPDVASKYLNLAEYGFGQCIEPAPGVESVVVDKGFDASTFFYELFGQVTPNKSIRARNEHSLILKVQGELPLWAECAQSTKS